MTLVLRNAGAPAGETNGRLLSLNPFIVIVDGEGVFPPARAGDTTASVTDFFRIYAARYAPIEVPLYCYLLLEGHGYQDTILVPLIVGDSMNLPVGPDSAGYRIYDWTDSCYRPLPEYEWVELRGRGEILTIGDDDTRWLELPADFGFWRYYGNEYRYLSVCANGWIAADSTSRCDFTNVELPYPGAPPNIVAFLWDDLAPSRYGNIIYYYDREGHRFIVEFDSISYFGMASRWERVQVQVYDTTVLGSDRDNPIAIQFQTVNDYSSVTVGLQNRDGSAGLTYLWNGHYPRTAAPLIPNRSLRIEWEEPTGGSENLSPKLNRNSIMVRPNPFRSGGKVCIIASEKGREYDIIEIYQSEGRLVKRLKSGRGPVLFWDGRDERGRSVAPGLYFLVLQTPEGVSEFQKLVVVR